MTIVPDEKDWTWVLRRPCPECGLDTSSFAREEIPAMTRANAAAWRAPLAVADAADRPRPDRWSALEYGCHVRDVFRLYDYRLGLMLTEDDPLGVDSFASHTLPLAEAPHAYDIFQKKQDGAVKIILKP